MAEFLVCEGVIDPSSQVCDTGYVVYSDADLAAALATNYTLSQDDFVSLQGPLVLCLVIAVGFRILLRQLNL